MNQGDMNQGEAEGRVQKVDALSGDLKEVPIEPTSNADVPSVYSNAVGFVATPFDVRFVFGQIKPKAGKLVNESLMSVVMSWEHAKALQGVLRQSIEEHERDFGPLYFSKATSSAQS